MIYAEVAKLTHEPDCKWNTEDYCDCPAIERHLQARIAVLESALGRITPSYRLILAGKSVRDAAETLAEADQALNPAK